MRESALSKQPPSFTTIILSKSLVRENILTCNLI